jgi:hypothetical protein
MELSTPEPWLPVVRTCSWPSVRRVTMPRWYSVRPGFLRSASGCAPSAAAAPTCLRAHHAQQGRAHESKEGHHHRHRIARQPEQHRLPMRPTAIGRPGRMAIFQNATSPSFFIMALVKSASPTLTPPLVMMASARAAAHR